MDLIPLLSELSQDLSNDQVVIRCKDAVDAFIISNEKTFIFSQLSDDDHNNLLKTLFTIILSGNVVTLPCIKVTRLLSRDKNLVLTIDSIPAYMKTFVSLINKDCELNSEGYLWKIESLKCLCNWVYHSSKVRQYFMENKLMKSMIEDIKNRNTKSLLTDTTFYETRLMFLMSALETRERSQMLEDGAVAALVHVLDEAWKNSNQERSETKSNTHFNIMCEVLKALFNVMLEISNSSSPQLITDCSKLVSIIRLMLVTFAPFNPTESDDLLTYIAHMLVNIPNESIHHLFLTIEETDIDIKEEKCGRPIAYNGYNMSAVIIMLDVLEERIKLTNYMVMKENVMAILTSFCYICRINPTIRKYLRNEILPSFKPSDLRPEEHDNMRGRIVKLMTTVDVQLKNMAADFLYVLCKENTERLVRYAGYGNSIGFLSSRGLMIPGMSKKDGDYSDDELTEIEDNDLDPMTGATAKPKEDMLSRMTESEKEEEMNKLMCMMDRLEEMDVIKPMVIGKDGKLSEYDGEGPDSSEG